MKTCNTFIQNLRLGAVLLLCAAGALLTTPQDAIAQSDVSSIEITSDAGNDNTYKIGEEIQATVTFTKVVEATDAAKLALRIGTGKKEATYKNGTETETLIFAYEVASGDTDTDGVSIPKDPLSGNIGTQGSNLTLLYLGLDDQESHKVDGVAPTVSSVAITSTATNNTYKKDDEIKAVVTFSESVTVETTGGTPQLTLKIGTANRNVSYTSGTGTQKLVFKYKVASDDADADGIEIEANKLTLNSGTITDTPGNAATLTHTAVSANTSHKVDGVAPTVSKVEITSTATGNTYKKDEKIQATMTFSENVTVSGTPQLTLTIGTTDKDASYVSGTGSTALVFEYTVASGDADDNGVSVEADKLELNSGTIKDAAGNAAALTHTAVTDQASHKVDGVVPTVSSVAITSTATNGYYTEDDKIQATVTFSENVTVTGSPQLTLTIGASDKTTGSVSGSGTTALVFSYVVVSGDADDNGVSIKTDQLSLNGGTITDAVGNAATLDHAALAAEASHKVDTVAPTVSSVAITSTAMTDNTYKKGDEIQATVTFSENVTVSGTPRLTLKIGTENKTADYTTGSGTTALVFEYTVALDDADADGIEIEANKLVLNSGTIKDPAGHDATLTGYTAVPTQASHKVDGVVPTVSSVEINSDAGDDKYYKLGDKIQATATFSETVKVTGTPQLTLKIGTTDRAADYKSGSDTTALVFEYTVTDKDNDDNGIEIEASKLAFNGGTITDAVGNAATLTHTAVAASTDHKVDGSVPTIATNGIAITSTTQPYKAGEIIQATVTFTENVYVLKTSEEAGPQLGLKIGTADGKKADYKEGSGTQKLVFEYTVVAGDTDDDGISVEKNQLSLNGGTIKDAAENDATLTHVALLAPPHKVDTTAPTVVATNGIRITSTAGDDNTYKTGDTIRATVTFSETVEVVGTPQLTLKIGTEDRKADYKSGTTSTVLVFEYTVASDDIDTDGIEIAADSLARNSGTIKDSAGNDATLTHTALTTQASHKVDAVKPAVASTDGITITSSAGSDAFYTAGDTIQATVTFTENVKVTGTPQLVELEIGAAYKTAVYQSGTDTKQLVFEYTVVAGDADTDGIRIEADTLALNGGTITDDAGNTAVLTHAALPRQDLHKVDAVKPRIAPNGMAIASTAGTHGIYKTGDTIQATMTFTENVTVSGTPQLTLTIGTENKTADYESGTGTTELAFAYTVVDDDTDTDGISIAAGTLNLNGATLKDAAENDAILTHPALTAQPSHKVDTTHPQIVTNGIAITSTPESNNTYKTGNTIQTTVTFTEKVTVTGTPQLTLKIGVEDRIANWTGGDDTTKLVFSYIVVDGDADTDGIGIESNKLELSDGTVTITDLAGNAADLKHPVLTAQPLHKVDTDAPGIVPNGIEITSNVGNDMFYTAGEKIQATVTFSKDVNVTTGPQLTLKIGTENKDAAYLRKNGTTKLIFEYTVATGNTDADGIEIETDSLSLNGGTITDSAGNDATLTHPALAVQPDHRVDAAGPAVSPNGITITSTPSTNNTYKVGETIRATVTFNENAMVTGTPTLALTIGTESKNATYTRGTNTTVLVFEYTVTDKDNDADGISIVANQLVAPQGATIKDSLGNDATLTHAALPTQSSHKVDTIGPTISRIAITSTPSSGIYYKVGDIIQATVTFTEKVNVTGTPQLTLHIGTENRQASWTSGTGTNALVFAYKVVSGDNDDNGISIVANSLSFNSGTIKDAAGNDAILTHTQVNAQMMAASMSAQEGAFGAVGVAMNAQIATLPLHKVDGLSPSINTENYSNGIAITSNPSDTTTYTYKLEEIIQATVTFTEKVNVTGTPELKLKIGTADRVARWTGGSGTTKLTFEYKVADGDNDKDGISIDANQLSLNNGTIKDEAGNVATLTHNALPPQSLHKVMTPRGETPIIRSVSLTSTGPYSAGDTIEATVSTSQSLTVTGTPTLTLVIGTTEKTALYKRGTGSPALVFNYTVMAGDTDTDGVTVKADSLALAGGTLINSEGLELTLTHLASPPGLGHTVDTTAPSVSSVALSSTGPYGVWSKIEVTVTTTEAVTVTGNAILTLILGNTEKRVNYQSGSETNTLVFSYTVAKGDGDDPDGISVKANSLSANGGTLLDEFGNALNLNHDALRDGGAQHQVDTTPPQVSSLAFTSTGPYGVGSIVQVTATTSEAVTVTGSPSLTLVIGNTDRPATYMGGTGTTALLFQYKITAADKDDTNGISLKANSLKLNSGDTVVDAAGNALKLTHSSVANAGEPQAVGMTISGISSVAITSTGPYRVNDIIKITVTTAEQVTVTGTPRMPIVIGKDTKYANYVSGTGTTALVFQYTVADGDGDTDGIEIAQNALEHYNGSVIKNSYHTHLDLSHPSVAADVKHIVDTTQPTITGVTFAADAPAVYTAGTTLEVVVTFAESGVQVTPDANGAMPSLSLLLGSNGDPDSQKKVVEASYTEARPGSTKLIFTYTITADTPIDADGIQIQANSLRLPAGVSIVDSSGNKIDATPSEDGSSLIGIKPSAQLSSRPILPSLTSAGIIFNEFLNAKTDKQDWVELRNTTDSAVSLAGWKLSISTSSSTLPNIVALPDMMIPGGAVLLLVNTGHKETDLELSNAYTYRYLKVPELRLRGSNFSLMLRDRSGAVVDVISNYASDTGAVEPATTFQRDEAYLREQPSTPGYESAAWQPSGYQGGLGYDRKAPKDTSLGTPGYLRSTLPLQGAAVSVHISEVMFTTGTSGQLPQWIELYNASKTEVVTLQGWRLQVEVCDLDKRPTHRFITFIIDKALRILPNQTVLVVAKGGRNSQHFPEQRVYNLTEQNPEKVDPLGPNAGILGDYGYAIVLRDGTGTQIDIAGNLDGESSTNDEPGWKLPNCITRNGFRTSIIRHYEDGVPLTGNKKSSWFRATEMRRQIITYYGHQRDVGNPGWKKGGPLPVQLSSFRAERTEHGALIQWTTVSELENAGFNVLRSESRTGTFTVVTPRTLQGAGTTSERSSYQYVDTTAKENVAYYYRLEEVSFSGVRQPVATRRLRGHVSAANRYLTMFGSLKNPNQ